jgi:hypothetical protein
MTRLQEYSLNQNKKMILEPQMKKIMVQTKTAAAEMKAKKDR